VKIPVRNVYYILCYAWKHAQELDTADLSEAQPATLPDLLGHVLAGSVSRLLSHGLDREYITREEEVPGVRGKLDISTTVKRNLKPRARTYCRFDDLDYDILSNRIIKATLRELARTEGLAADIRKRVSRLYRKLDAISDIELRTGHFRRVHIHRNNRLYDFVLHLCRIIHDSVTVDERTGRKRFHDFTEDEARMGALFEDFVREFYRREQKNYRVASPRLSWRDAQGSPADLERLPIMRTDVVLSSAERTVILDAKFYREALAGQHGKRVRSGHLYQIFAYLENWDGSEVGAPLPEGMLLYPVVKRPFAYDYTLRGKHVRIRSIDLDQDWRKIQADMLALISPGTPTGATLSTS